MSFQEIGKLQSSALIRRVMESRSVVCARCTFAWKHACVSIHGEREIGGKSPVKNFGLSP